MRNFNPEVVEQTIDMETKCKKMETWKDREGGEHNRNRKMKDIEGLSGLGLQQVNYGGLIDWPLVCSK